MEQVEDGHVRQKVLEAVCAIEMHMVLSCKVIRILQSLSIRFIGKVGSSQIRYQRLPSEGILKQPLCIIFGNILPPFKKPKSCITQMIHKLQAKSEKQGNFLTFKWYKLSTLK